VSIDSAGAKARAINCTKESTLQRSISEAKVGPTSISNEGDRINPSSPLVWDQGILPSSLVSPTAHEAPPIANPGAGRYGIPSICQIFNLASTSPH
jgi:hypothetical protein